MTRKTKGLLAGIIALIGGLVTVGLLPDEQAYFVAWGGIAIFVALLFASVLGFPVYFYLQDRSRRLKEQHRETEGPEINDPPHRGTFKLGTLSRAAGTEPLRRSNRAKP